MRKLYSAIALLSIGFAVGGSQLAIAQTPFYKQTNLISDDKSVIDARFEDSFVVNAWGLTSSPTSPWWIADNGSGVSTLYNAATNTIPYWSFRFPAGSRRGGRCEKRCSRRLGGVHFFERGRDHLGVEPQCPSGWVDAGASRHDGRRGDL